MSAARPKNRKGTRLCLTVTRQGVIAYGNRAAFESLSEWFKWIASSAASEHYECHTIWNLQDEASLFSNNTIKNVYALLNEDSQSIFGKKTAEEFGFELTFMMSTESELDELASFQKDGMLPGYWNSETRIIVK